MAVAIIIGDHHCPKFEPGADRNMRFDVEYYRALNPGPFSAMQARVRCMDCGEGVGFDLIYDVKVQKTVSVHVGA